MPKADTGADFGTTISLVFSSEFFWGIFVGLIFSFLISYANIRFDSLRKRRIISSFCLDTIESICRYTEDLVEGRRRNARIDDEIIEQIIAEIGIFGRNRENLVLIDNPTLRTEVRDFVNRSASYASSIKFHLQRFYQLEAKRRASSSDASSQPPRSADEVPRTDTESMGALNAANQSLNQLNDLRVSKRDDLKRPLEDLARRSWHRI